MPFISVTGRTLEYEWRGESAPGKPTLVFLHEGLGSIEQWRDFPLRVASATGCAALVYSRYGYGQSDVLQEPRPPSFMHDEALRSLSELLSSLNIPAPVLLGHSDGASIALIHAGAGHAVRGLVLEAPHVFVEEHGLEGIREARRAFETTDLRQRLGKYHRDAARTFRGWNDVWLSPAFRHWNIEKLLSGSRGPAVARDASATCSRPCPRPKKSWVALLARRHAQRAVEADRLAVQHRVLDDVAHERRELARPAETRGKGDLRGERLALRLGEHREHRRVEGPGRDGHDPDAERGEVARDGQRHADDAAFGCGIGRLTDLPVEGGGRRGVDHDAALTLVVGRVLRHLRCRQTGHVEGADQVHLDHLGKDGERHRPVLADRLHRGSDPRAVDRPVQRPEALDRARHSGGHLPFARDVGRREQRAFAELAPHVLARRPRPVEDHPLAAGLDQGPYGREPEARGSTGDEGDGSRCPHGTSHSGPGAPVPARLHGPPDSARE